MENDDLTAPEWLQNIEQRATVEPNPNDSRVELKPDAGNLVKMTSPATHEDLSQFLNKFPSGSFKILALLLNAWVKGQIISEGNFGVFKPPKKRTKFFRKISALVSKVDQIKNLRFLLYSIINND